MRPLRTKSLSVLVFAALLLVPAVVCGAEGEQNQAAVDLAYEGKERFEAADYATALDRFQKARTLAGSPVLDLYVARSLKALGRWREALLAYEEAGKHMVDGSNVSFLQAQQNASRERQELAAKMPKLSVTAPHAPAVTPPELHIDAEPAPWPASGLALDPGKHVLAATLDGETYDEVVTLSPGQALTIELPFGRAEPKEATPAAATTDSDGKHGLSPLAWTAFGIGAAGLLVGATTGTWAIVNMGQLGNMSSGDEGYEDLKATTGTLATTADIGFIVAGAGALLGVTFALTLGKGEKASTASTSLQLRPAGTGMMLSGAF